MEFEEEIQGRSTWESTATEVCGQPGAVDLEERKTGSRTVIWSK